MEALDTTLYEEGTQVPLNPHTTSSQVSHKDTTVEKALEGAVNFTPQDLTPEQQAQARENINALEDEAGVIGEEHIATGAVTTDKLADDAVTAKKLAKGARRPIILTPDTTEVDEETYQKLLSDDVDVMYKIGTGNLCLLTIKIERGDLLNLYFNCLSVEGLKATNVYIYGFKVSITKSGPHNCSVTRYIDDNLYGLFELSNYLTKSTLSPVLKEIDLTGTDEERKAKLDQFAKDWKALTGASDLTGARFVGRVPTIGGEEGTATLVLLNYDVDDKYGGISTTGLVDVTALKKITVSPLDGSIQVTPLFSHLEAITIKTSGSPSDNVDNIAAIKAYENNLTALGIDITKGYTIPVYISGMGSGFLCKTGDNILFYMGVMNRDGSSSFGISVDAGGNFSSYKLQTETNNTLTTTSKKIVGAINEVETLAKGTKAFGAIELKAEDNAANKAALTAYLKMLTDAGVSTANGYAVPVRITGNSQEYHGMLNIGTGVLLSGIVTDVNENRHYPFNVSTTDGVITFDESNYFLEKASNEVTEMLDAIKYSHTSVPFTDTTLSNKAQLEVFLSKVPDATVMHCTYKEIWAGTLHKINGDWYGLLVKNTNNPADNINIKLSADGTITESNSAQ